MKTIHAGLLVCILLKLVEAVPLASFYTFGPSAGDTTLHRNDDHYSPLISFSTEFSYFGTNHDAVYVNNNGVVSFDTPVSTFTPEAFPINGSRVLLSPYWADVDTRPSNGGFVYYRQSTDSILLTKAMNQVHTLFPAFSNFTPTFLFIATWDHVGYYKLHTDKTNTFQCVMITDGTNSFVAFLYADGLIQWTTGDASGGRNGLGGTEAQGGFNAGDGVRFFSINDSQTPAIVNIETTSNVGVPGLWMFQVDQNAVSTPSAPPDIDECALGTHDCSPNADCIDTTENYTCICRSGFTGDGRTCTVVVGFEHETYSIGEDDGSVEVCVQVNGVLQNSLRLSLTTVDGAATASADYTNKSIDLMFGSSSRKRCVLISVLNDTIPEVSEHFRVVLSMTTPLAGVILTPDNATVVINDDDVAPEPEVGCTIELFVLAATWEKEQQKLVETVQEILPGIFPTSNSTVNDTTRGRTSLTTVYNSLTKEFGVNKSESGYSKFVEAINEITEAKQESCSGDVQVVQLNTSSIPRLVQEFRTVLGTTQRDLLKLRTIFGKMLCIKDQIERLGSRKRKRRLATVSPGSDPIPCEERTPEECTCPPGGFDGDCIVCPCEFFQCLDPEDVLRPILGFVADDLQCLAFVVDTTGSMGDEIAAAQGVIKSFIKSEEELNEVGCYILMPFNDVHDVIRNSVGPITVGYTDQHVELQEFLRAVDNVRNGAYFGGDCAEYALDGILQTLEATDTDDFDLMTPGSQIIVLTDAPSKNTAIERRVIDLAKEQSVCVHFFLALETGNCFSTVPGSVEMYRRIAQETGGTVVSNAWQFSNFVASHRDSGSCTDFYPELGRRKRLAAMDVRCQSFRVSRFTNLLKLSVRPSVTGLSAVTVRKPGGSTASPQVIDPHSSNRFAVFSELYPESGLWSVCVDNGTVQVSSKTETTLDVVVLYPKNESHSSGATPTTSSPPPACTGGRIAVVTSRSAEMSSAYLNIVGRNRTIVAHIPLSKCSEFLVGNTTFPLGTFTYELGGQDQDGNSFVYDTKKNVTFGPGSSYYTFSAVNGTSLEIDYDDIFSLTYELNNTNAYGPVTFNFAAEPVDGFSRFIRPHRATVGAGESVQVILTASIGSSRIRRGSSHTFTVTATNDCTTLSASKTVNIRAPPPTTPPPSDLCGCQNGGTCTVLVRRGRQFPRCRCPSGYRGTKCQIRSS